MTNYAVSETPEVCYDLNVCSDLNACSDRRQKSNRTLLRVFRKIFTLDHHQTSSTTLAPITWQSDGDDPWWRVCASRHHLHAHQNHLAFPLHYILTVPIHSPMYGPIWCIRVYVVGIRPHDDLFESFVSYSTGIIKGNHAMLCLLEGYRDCSSSAQESS